MQSVRKIICLLVAIGFLLSLNMAKTFAEGSAMTDWDREIISATGYGVGDPARAKNPGHLRIMAHQAAILDGYRRLAEQGQGIQVSGNSSIADNISTGDVVSGQFEAVVKRARIVSESYDEYNNCTVVMEVPLFGVTNSIAKAVFKPVEKEAFPQPTININVDNSVNQTVNQTVNQSQTINQNQTVNNGTSSAQENTNVSTVSAGGYTGLIVDCSGLGLKPVMSPVIRNANQQPIYGYKNLDYDRVIAHGMASYTTSMSGNVSRAGSNPLIVKAVSLAEHNSYPVLSMNDSNKVLSANQSSHFLEMCAVVFVR